MKLVFLFLLVGGSVLGMAQSADTIQTAKTAMVKKDSLIPNPAQRVYKVDMMSQTPPPDTNKTKAPNFMEPYQAKRLESNYQYEDGKVSGGSTQLKLGKKKKN